MGGDVSTPLVSPRPCATAVRFEWVGPGERHRYERVSDGSLDPRHGFRSAGIPPTVMPGLVPGIHVLRPVRPFPAHTAMPQDVDTRNKSGYDDKKGSAGGRRHRPTLSPTVRAEPLND